ncbi:MAG: hypothetical protein K6G62_05935 [Eubacterium sp.]|nr:hypothetical protein [Eubacterium sp.]
MRQEERFKMLVEEPDAVRCKNCSGRMVLIKSELYRCQDCGATYLTYFGRVKKCIDENGFMTIQELEEKSGVPGRVLRRFVREGSLQASGMSGGMTVK